MDLTANTTGQLVADLEALREHLGISAWVVQGVSWGSTLALAYAQRHPRRVLGMVLFAVTTTSRREIDWITEGVGALYPEAWDAFAGFAERHGDFDRHADGPGRVRIVEAYRRMLAGAEPALVDAAAAAWCSWEQEHIRIGAPPDRAGAPSAPIAPAEVTAQQRGLARLVTHYWAHDGFVADWTVPAGGEPGSGLLGGMERLKGIPGVLIHGRRDVSGPVRTAWEVHRAWPGSELIVIEEEGHGGPRMVERWTAAMAHLATVIGP